MNIHSTTNFAIKIIASYALSTGASTLFAHEQEGMNAIHWHTTDTAGLLTVAVLAALAIWLSCRGK